METLKGECKSALHLEQRQFDTNSERWREVLRHATLFNALGWKIRIPYQLDKAPQSLRLLNAHASLI
jgi:hypothetical protein